MINGLCWEMDIPTKKTSMVVGSCRDVLLETGCPGIVTQAGNSFAAERYRGFVILRN